MRLGSSLLWVTVLVSAVMLLGIADAARASSAIDTSAVGTDTARVRKGVPAEKQLAPLTEEELHRYLREVREDPVYYKRANFATALGRRKETRAVLDLCKAMRTDSVALVRADIIQAIGMIGDRRAVPCLREAMGEDPNIRNRCAAAQVLAERFGEKGAALRTLLDIFAKKDFDEVDWGNVVDRPDLPDSLRTVMMAREPHVLVRAALGSLERIGGEQVIAGLEEAAKSPDKEVRESAKAALGRLRAKKSAIE